MTPRPYDRFGALMALVLLLANQAAPASDSTWPQFRGPHRSGVSPETNLLARLPDGGPAVLWSVGAGVGYSGIAVIGEHVYTMGQADGAQFLWALDAGDGHELWRYQMGEAYTSPYGDGPRSTPVVDGESIFAIDAGADLHAVRTTDGKRIWSHDLAELGARVPSSGYASTPLVVGQRLLVESGGKDGAHLAFDKKDGSLQWAAGADVAAYSSPIEITIDGIQQVVFFSGSGLNAVSPADGRPLWHYPWRSLCPATGVPLNSASPIHVPPDRIFIASGYGDDHGAALLRIRRHEGRFAVDTVWRENVLDSRINSAVELDGVLYGFHGALLQAVDVETGRELWKMRGFQRGSLIAADAKLIVLGEQGTLGLIRPTPDGNRDLGRFQVLNGRSWTSPSLADGRLYVRNLDRLVSVDLRPRRPRGATRGEAATAPSKPSDNPLE